MPLQRTNGNGNGDGIAFIYSAPKPDLTVVWDSMEEIPFRFPTSITVCDDRGLPISLRIASVRKRILDPSEQAKSREPLSHPGWGDYTAVGYESLVAFERKWSLSEIADNYWGAKRKRFSLTLERFAQRVKHPYLVLDMRWCDLFSHGHGRRRKYGGDSGGIGGSGRGSGCGVGRGSRGSDLPDFPRVRQELFRRCHALGIEIIGPIPARTLSQRLSAGRYLLERMWCHISETTAATAASSAAAAVATAGPASRTHRPVIRRPAN